MTEERHGNNHRHQGHSENDQVVANFEHGTLEMADGMSALDQLRCLTKVSLLTGGVNHRVGFAPLDNGARKDRLPRFARRRQGFSGQRGLIDLNGIACQQPRIGRDDVPQPQTNDVARHEFRDLRGTPLSISQRLGRDRQLGPQGSNFVARLMFLPKCHHRVGEKQKKNDEEVQPVPNHPRQNDRRFDHPRNGAPEIAEELQECIGFLLRDLVRTILRQPFLRLGLAEAFRRRSQFLLQLRHWQGFQIVFRVGRVGLGPRLRFRSLGLRFRF